MGSNIVALQQHEAMQGGSRRQNKYNKPKKPVAPMGHTGRETAWKIGILGLGSVIRVVFDNP